MADAGAPCDSVISNEAALPLREVLEGLVRIPAAEWEYLRGHVRERKFARGGFVVREGERSVWMDFMVRGVTRAYYLHQGAEITRNFSFAPRFVVDYESVISKRPSLVSIGAIEPALTLAFPAALLPELYERHPCWDRLGRKVAEQVWLEKEEKERRFRRYTPEQHYALLVSRGSPLATRVPLRHLASYLGVAPETLSRIRARLRRRARPIPAALDVRQGKAKPR